MPSHVHRQDGSDILGDRLQLLDILDTKLRAPSRKAASFHSPPSPPCLSVVPGSKKVLLLGYLPPRLEAQKNSFRCFVFCCPCLATDPKSFTLAPWLSRALAVCLLIRARLPPLHDLPLHLGPDVENTLPAGAPHPRTGARPWTLPRPPTRKRTRPGVGAAQRSPQYPK